MLELQVTLNCIVCATSALCDSATNFQMHHHFTFLHELPAKGDPALRATRYKSAVFSYSLFTLWDDHNRSAVISISCGLGVLHFLVHAGW